MDSAKMVDSELRAGLEEDQMMSPIKAEAKEGLAAEPEVVASKAGPVGDEFGAGGGFSMSPVKAEEKVGIGESEVGAKGGDMADSGSPTTRDEDGNRKKKGEAKLSPVNDNSKQNLGAFHHLAPMKKPSQLEGKLGDIRKGMGNEGGAAPWDPFGKPVVGKLGGGGLGGGGGDPFSKPKLGSLEAKKDF